MSYWQAPHEFIDVANAALDDYQYPPQSAPQGVSSFIDGSGPISSMYLERAKEEDEKMAKSWDEEAGQVFLFTGLFAAVLATLITMSIQDIQLSPQDTSNFYLANIQQALTDPNPSNISLPSSPPPFHPSRSAIWVNSLWVLSLVINLTCAVLANLIQHWTRKYLKVVTQPRYSLHKRARIRAFYAEGVEKLYLPWVFEALPAMLHLSVFFFFAGLAVFLWKFDPTISKLVLSWVGICTAFYAYSTIIPISRHDSPYYTPFTPLARRVAIMILYVPFFLRNCLVLLLSTCNCYGSFCSPIWQYLSREGWYGSLTLALHSSFMGAGRVALMASPEIDTRAFMWTFDSLEEDQELERFFTGLPGFRNSKVVDDPLPMLSSREKERISESLIGFLDRTFSSNLLPEAVKTQRAIIAAKALDPTQFNLESDRHLHDTIFRACLGRPQTTNFGPIANDGRTDQTVLVQVIVTGTVARLQEREDSWFRRVTANALGIPEAVFRGYAADGDSLPLAVLIHVIRQQFTYLRHPSWPMYAFGAILEEGSKFKARNTSLELQHEFCALWNQIVLEAKNSDDSTIVCYILKPIRHIYVTLHPDPDSAPTEFSTTPDGNSILELPSSYPMCKVHGRVHSDPPSASFTHTVLHNTTALVPPDSPSSPTPVPLHDIERPTDVPSLDNSHPARTTIEGLRSPFASANIAIASGIRHIDTSGIAMPHITPETSTSACHSRISPPPAVAPQQNADRFTASDPPNIPSLDSMNPVLDNMLPTGSHRPIIVSTAPSASPGMTFTPDSGAAAGPAPGLGEENDTSDPPR